MRVPLLGPRQEFSVCPRDNPSRVAIHGAALEEPRTARSGDPLQRPCFGMWKQRRPTVGDSR